MFACLALLATALVSQDASQENEFGINLGWGNPFGTSIQVATAVSTQQSVGAGVGFSLSGVRFGLDYKYLFRVASKFNPYLGLAGSYASGLAGGEVYRDTDTAKYDLNGGLQATPRGGFRYRAGFGNLYLNVGYGIPVVGGGVTYVSGSTKGKVKSTAETFGMGGVEVSGSVMLRF